MPFTFAHPALVLPLKNWKNKLSLTGLIVGSIAPDFEFLFQMHVTENRGHHIYGILILDLPLSILLCYGFHNLIRKGLIENLPSWLQIRLQNLSFFNWNEYVRKNFGWVFISIIIGILSHLLADSFTHKNGEFVILFPVLRNSFLFMGYHLPIYLILQMMSSFLGISVLYFYVKGIPIQRIPKKKSKDQLIYWTFFLLFVLIYYLLE